MYYLKNGESVTADQIKTAYKAGLCILVHQHSPRGTITALATDGVHMDTRHDDDLISLSDAVWTTAPASLREALNAAYIHM